VPGAGSGITAVQDLTFLGGELPQEIRGFVIDDFLFAAAEKTPFLDQGSPPSRGRTFFPYAFFSRAKRFPRTQHLPLAKRFFRTKRLHELLLLHE
jgi:hypothetical protein